MTTIYSAHIEVRERDVTDKRALTLIEQLRDYHAAVGTSPRGWLDFQLSVPGETFSQASTTAFALISSVVPGVEIVHADIMTEAEFDALNGFVPVPPLLSVTETGDELGVSRQRVLQMIDEGLFPTATKVGKTIVIARSDVESKASMRPSGG